MRIPRRSVVDYDVDRSDVEALQGAKLTDTNRPFGLAISLDEAIWLRSHRRLTPRPASGPVGVESKVSSETSMCSPRRWLEMCCTTAWSSARAQRSAAGLRSSRFLVTIAEGSHPIPSRTRKLSPPAPMVLQGTLCGRVGRCQIYGPVPRKRGTGPFFIGSSRPPPRNASAARLDRR